VRPHFTRTTSVIFDSCRRTTEVLQGGIDMVVVAFDDEAAQVLI
jgi:hypothetical protein